MSIPNITSQEQYDALLPGTKYRRSDGQIKTKSGSAPMQAKPLDGFLSGLRAAGAVTRAASNAGAINPAVALGAGALTDLRAAGTAVRAGSGLINPAVTLGAGALTDYAADVIEEPVKTLVTDPAMAVYDMPSNIQKSGALGGGALAALATGRPAIAGRLGKQAALTGLEAAGGAAELAGLAPAIGPLAKTGVATVKGIIKAPGQVYRGTRRAFNIDTPDVPTKSISDEIAEQVADDFNVDKPLYHGSQDKFDEFDDKYIGKRDDGFYGRGHYLTPNEGEASYYGPNVGEFYTKGKMLDLSGKGKESYLGSDSEYFRFWTNELDKIDMLDEPTKKGLNTLKKIDDYVDQNIKYIKDGESAGEAAYIKSPSKFGTQRIFTELGKDFNKQQAKDNLKKRFLQNVEMNSDLEKQFPHTKNIIYNLDQYIRFGGKGADEFAQSAKKAGYDGIIAEGGDEVVMFDPKNIRSKKTQTRIDTIPQGKEQNIYDYMRSVSGIKDPKEFRSSLLRAADDETVRPDMLLQDPNLPGYSIAGVGLGRRAGPSQNIMQKAARAQQSEQSQRVNEAFNVALGRPKDMIDTLDDINIRIDEESKPLYDKAFAKGIQPTEELQEVLNIPLVKDYRDKAVKDLAYMGQATENQLEILDQVKKSLDDEIGRNIQQNTKKRARDLIIIKNKLLKEIDKANPEYAQARSVFAGEEANKNAMDYGLKNITNKKTRPKQFARDIEKYSKSEKEALLSGIKDQIDILLDNPESYSALKGQFRTPSFKAKLETVIGKEKAETLVNDLVRQAELADTAKATDVGANSITASAQEAMKLAEQPAKSEAMQAIAKGTEAVGDVRNLANLIPFLSRKISDKTLRTLGKAGDVVDEDITTAAAQLLTMPTRDAAQMLLDLDIDVRKKISGRLLDNSQGVKILRALPKQSALTALGGLTGAGVVSATTPNIVNITTQQQYDSLPAGARYRRSDGQILTKR